MEYFEFEEELNKKTNEINCVLSEDAIKDFFDYMNDIIEKNKTVNLTAIVEPSQMIEKHFVDCLSIIDLIEKEKNVVDVGTGAGFPGIPVAIARKDLRVTLVDSLRKRVDFLNEIQNHLELKNIETFHYRAEDFGSNKDYREAFDYAVSRAVASLNVLLEYLSPLVKVGGMCICMKGPKAEEELKDAKNAMEKLGLQVVDVKKIFIGTDKNERNIIVLKKYKSVPQMYPRKAGIPSKKPL